MAGKKIDTWYMKDGNGVSTAITARMCSIQGTTVFTAEWDDMDREVRHTIQNARYTDPNVLKRFVRDYLAKRHEVEWAPAIVVTVEAAADNSGLRMWAAPSLSLRLHLLKYQGGTDLLGNPYHRRYDYRGKLNPPEVGEIPLDNDDGTWDLRADGDYSRTRSIAVSDDADTLAKLQQVHRAVSGLLNNLVNVLDSRLIPSQADGVVDAIDCAAEMLTAPLRQFDKPILPAKQRKAKK